MFKIFRTILANIQFGLREYELNPVNHNNISELNQKYYYVVVNPILEEYTL